MKKDRLDPIVWALTCKKEKVPDEKYVVLDEQIIPMIEALETLEETDKYGRTLLMYAVIEERNRIAEYLISHGAQINRQDKNGFSALHFAAQTGDVEIIRMLLQSGAAVNEKECFGNSPIMRCSGNVSKEAVALFIQYGADPLLKNNYGVCALDIYAARDEIMDILKNAV
ncbi:MAG: ankyrin repeat domain-containing protein [Clostridia bacterium]|nr:ankyrin repeat domain-containing protein [Clostridia bacterium]